MTKIVRTQIPITYITRTNSIITTMKYATPVKTEQTGGLYARSFIAWALLVRFERPAK